MAWLLPRLWKGSIRLPGSEMGKGGDLAGQGPVWSLELGRTAT